MGLIIFYFVAILLFIRSSISNVSLLLVLRWIKNTGKAVVKNQDYDFIVVIPVLREQAVIEKTLQHFLNLVYPHNKITIIVVTTEKEYIGLKSEERTTIDIVDDFKRKGNELYGRDMIQRIHFPKTNGKMVDQLNYAFSHILKKFKGNRNKFFVSIYNADSRPNLDTFQAIANAASLNENKKVFQQSAIYYDNFHEVKKQRNWLEARYAQTNGTLHSRWTLAHEFPRLFRQSYFLNTFKKRIFLSHCVGHGLFLRGDLIEDIKEMPTGTVTEDLFFGYVLSLFGESINPVAVMEMAEMPSSLVGAMKQKYVWFFGPLDHFNYEKYFLKKFPDRSNKMRIRWFTLQGILPAFIWLFQGWFLLYLFLYPVASGYYNLMWLSLALFFFYGPLSYLIILRNYSCLSKLSSKDDKICNADIFWILVFCLPVVILHSMPPAFSIYSKMRFYLTGLEPQKPKTER